jgi:hypothetical protein
MMKKKLTLMLAATLAFAGCQEDEAEQVALTIDKTVIKATCMTGVHPLIITGNATWTAATSAGWCTVSPAAGSGNATIAVNVSANVAAVARAATVTIAAGTLSKTVEVAQEARTTPLYAASVQTWTFGTQTWSDAIRISTCNKTAFENNATTPQCRSHTNGANTWYYYNGTYVDANKTLMCPDPWRVPTQSDFKTLAANTTGAALAAAWGYGGYASGNGVHSVSTYADYWSATLHGDMTSFMYCLYFDTSGYITALQHDNGYLGFQVRCVR